MPNLFLYSTFYTFNFGCKIKPKCGLILCLAIDKFKGLKESNFNHISFST